MIASDEGMNKHRPKINPRTGQVAVIVDVHIHNPEPERSQIECVLLIIAGDGSLDRKSPIEVSGG